jgi:hypothetical protein
MKCITTPSSPSILGAPVLSLPLWGSNGSETHQGTSFPEGGLARPGPDQEAWESRPHWAWVGQHRLAP